MRRGFIGTMTLLLAVCVAAALPGLTIKLGSLAPVSSPWDVALRRMAGEWEKLSGGTITVKIYSGGIAGDESDMVRKIRIGALNAAAITVSGLQGIFKGAKTLSYPLLLRSDDELAYVLEKMKPLFDTELQKRGFKPVGWSMGGWVYIFSRYPIQRPDDLRKQKLWVWSGDPDEIQAYQSAGFQTVTIASTDLMTSLQGGMVDAFAASPLVAASSQWFGIATNMYTLKLGPLWGATIVGTKTWAEIPEDLKPKLMDAAQKIFDSIEPDLVKANSQAMDVMKKYGLKINQVTPQAETEWDNLLGTTFSGLVGKLYDRNSFELVSKYLDQYLVDHPRR